MSRLYLASPLGPLHNTDGTALNTSVTLTDISPLPQVVPVSVLGSLEIGTEFEINAYGEFSTTTGPPTLLIGAYWGGAAGTALAATAATATTASVTSVPWSFYYRGRIRAIGATGSIKGLGFVTLGTSLTAGTPIAAPATAAARTVTIDTTTSGAKALTIAAQWGTSSVSNSITCYDMSIVVTS